MSTVNDAELQAAIRPQLLEVANSIAEATRRRAKDHDYVNSVEVEATAEGVRVFTNHPFAHLDEWGSVNNPPTAAMRSAAAEHGRFEPAPKP